MESVTFSGLGNRTINQDYLHAQHSFYIVCDGVGGRPYGEVASKLACSSLADYLTQNPAPVYNSEFLNRALHYTIQQFQQTENKYHETKGMSTTVALVLFDNAGANIAWLGDSRAYHIRNGEILFVTEDHSLINELAQKGEDVSQVKRNIITKSLNAKTESGFSIKTIGAGEIHKNDFFFLCTDGVLENLTSEKIKHIFSHNNSAQNIRFLIINECEGKTNDNYTFQIIKT